jgi:uncharacterized repeat protein (TIGR02543 family)
MNRTSFLSAFVLLVSLVTGLAGCGGTVATSTSSPSAPTYTVTYAANGATSGTVPIDGNKYLAGATVTVLGNTGSLVQTGYTFAGWNTASSGSGTSYSSGATFAMGSANVMLYAQWTALPTYTVT